MDIKTIADLHTLCAQAIIDGYGDCPVFFDTEARTFNYHMAKVGRGYYEEEPYKHMNLHEERD